MIVLKSRREILNFYESFSDLIFNTLVLFLFLILGLVVNVNKRVESVARDETRVASRLRESEQRLEELRKAEVALVDRRAALDKEAENLASAVAAQKARSDQLDREIDEKRANLKKTIAIQDHTIRDAKRRIADLVGSTRFTGTSGSAVLIVACIPTTDGGRFYFLPGDAEGRYEAKDINETLAQFEDRKRKIVREVIAYAKEQRGLTVSGFNELLQSVSWFRGGNTERTRVGIRTGGPFLQDVANTFGEEYSPNLQDRMFRELKPDPTRPDVKPLPTLRVVVPAARGNITVGDNTVLTPKELVCVLRASSGTKLAIELELEEGENIPQWFLEDVMVLTGYVNRVPDLPAADP